MNKLIEELAAQAEIYVDSCHADDTKELYWIKYKEKFAELIVRECAEIANNNYNKGFCPVGGFIEDHFELGSNLPG